MAARPETIGQVELLTAPSFLASVRVCWWVRWAGSAWLAVRLELVVLPKCSLVLLPFRTLACAGLSVRWRLVALTSRRPCLLARSRTNDATRRGRPCILVWRLIQLCACGFRCLGPFHVRRLPGAIATVSKRIRAATWPMEVGCCIVALVLRAGRHGKYRKTPFHSYSNSS